MRGLRLSWRLAGLTLVCAANVALTGCTRQPQPSRAAPVADAGPVNPEPAAPPDSSPPAQSSLAIKRGIVQLAQERATFRPCGEQHELWMIDQTDGVLAQAFADAVQKGPAMLYVEAYGERTTLAPDVPAAQRYAGTLLLEEVLYAGVEGEVHGCDAPAGNYVVAARGSEPFWSVEVGDEGMVWRQADEPREVTLGAPQMQDAEGTVRYHATGNGHELELLIDAQSCRDPMSGEFFAYAAKAVFDSRQFSGCARVGR